LGVQGVTIPEATRSGMRRRDQAAAPVRRRSIAPLRPPPRDAWVAIAGVVLIYAAHGFYGALVSDASLVMDIAAALLVCGALASPRLRQDLSRLKGLALPASLFAVVIFVALWTLTPFTPGGPHPVWAYVGAAAGASTIDKSATLIEIVKLLGLACLFVAGLAAGARDDRARYAVQLTIVLGVVFGLWAFFGSVSGAEYSTGGRRLEAHFLNPNSAGTVFAMLLMLAISELVRTAQASDRRARLSRSLPLGAACLTFAVCLLDSASRGAAMAFLGAALIYMAFQLATGRLKFTRLVAGLLAGVIILVALVGLAGEQLIDRLFESHEASIVRGEIWRVHWQAFLDSPLFGYGLGGAESVSKSLLSLQNFDILWNIKAILNLYLQWLEEAGIVGAVPMFLCVAALILPTARGALRRSRMTGLLAGLLAVDAVVLIHGATDFGLEVPSIAGFWAWLLGLQFSLAQGSSRR